MINDVVIIGGGGHAKVIIDIFKTQNKYRVIGFTSSEGSNPVKIVPMVGDDSILPELFKKGIRKAFIAIGDCKLRDIIFNKVKALDFEIVSAISPYSNISTSVKIGDGVAIMPGVTINVDSVIEDNAIINTNASIDHDNYIRKSAHIGPGSNLAGNVTVGCGTFIGVGTKVIPKMEIGDWSIVGAGSVVINKIPSYTTSVGVPCKVIKSRK